MTGSFAFYISVLRKHFRKYCAERLVEEKITYGQLFVLSYLSRRDGCTPKEVGEALRLDAGHLNRTLGKLKENDLVLEEKNPEDRREKLLHLTKGGKALCGRCRLFFQEWDEQQLAMLSPEERTELLRLLQKIGQSLNGSAAWSMECDQKEFKEEESYE